MLKFLVVDNSARDAQRFQSLLAKEGVGVEICLSGIDAERLLTSSADGFAAAVILWDLMGPISGSDLLRQCHRLWPDMPVIVMSDSLDASMATRAHAFGARDFLAKPLDSERIRSCLRELLSVQDPLSPLIVDLRARILGQSPAIIATLKQVARVIPHTESRVLLVGESGTGKELFAQAIHQLGPRSQQPWIPVNVTESPATLIESALFGYEKGAFTGAEARHIGFLERARDGTVFLDEIGDLELQLQTKLLRVIQEKKFRRLSGNDELDFRARLVCATNRDLAAAVKQLSFRRDLFHRIAEVTIQVPPLRERNGDVDFLLSHFLDLYKDARQVTLARETLQILRSYPFDGNVRELENLVRAALIQCEGEVILPHHLPLESMRTLLTEDGDQNRKTSHQGSGAQPPGRLIEELVGALPDNWMDITYREATQNFTRAFDRIYFQEKLEKSRHNISRAAREAGIDAKTFRKRWRESGLPPLGGDDENHE